MANGSDSGSWIEYRKMVLSEITRLNKNIEKLEEKSGTNIVEISRLKVWSALYGAAGGTVAVLFLKAVIDKW